jgi:hypothetical protein
MRRALSSVVLLACAAHGAAADDEAAADADESAAPIEAGRPVDKGSFGVGLVLGEPTGISAKLYLGDDTALQAAIGLNFVSSGFQVNAEYLLHPWIVQERDAFVMPVYLGPGMRAIQYDGGRGAESHFAFGLRGVLGLLFDFKNVPLDAFVEVAGVIEYDTDEAFEPAFNLGAGVRYYF